MVHKRFTTPIDVRFWGPRRVMLLQDIVIQGIMHRKGMYFDGASTPRAFWFLLPPFADCILAGCVHDGIYRAEKADDIEGVDPVVRAELDEIIARRDDKALRAWADCKFYRQLKEDRVNIGRRGLGWSSLRAFGWAAYRKKFS